MQSEKQASDWCSYFRDAILVLGKFSVFIQSIFTHYHLLYLFVHYSQKRLEMHPRKMDTSPCKTRNRPITQAKATKPANGCIKDKFHGMFTYSLRAQSVKLFSLSNIIIMIPGSIIVLTYFYFHSIMRFEIKIRIRMRLMLPMNIMKSQITRKHHHPHKQMSESFLVAAFLSFSGGLQDVYTYISRGNVFANAQTGNIVLLSKNLFERNWHLAVHYFIPVLFFSLGVAAAERIRQSFQNTQRIHWRQLVLIIEILLLLSVGFMPEKWNLTANALVSFSCAMQVQAFRKVNSYAFASTMCIGNLRSGMEALCAYQTTGNKKILYKAFHYFGVILLFASGAGIGSHFIPAFGIRTIWISCICLSIAFLFRFIKEEYEDKTKQYQ